MPALESKSNNELSLGKRESVKKRGRASEAENGFDREMMRTEKGNGS